MEKNYTSAVERAGIDQGLKDYFIGVYNHMAGGLVVTALCAFVVANTSLINLMFSPHGGMSVLGWLFLFAPLIVVFGFGWVVSRGTLSQVRGVFIAYSALMGVSLAPIFLVYTGASMAKVFLITAGTFGGMSLYGYTTKRDLTSWGSFLRMGLWGLIIAMIVNIFMKSSAFDYALSILAVAIFVGLTAYDTQKIREIYMAYDDSDIRGKKVIVGALSLYLDFINLFMALLRLMGDRR